MTVAGPSVAAESVVADSLVLRPKTPFNGSARASGAKLFSGAKFAAHGVAACEKIRSRCARQTFARCKSALRDASQSHVSSALLRSRDFSARVCVVAEFFRSAFYRRCAALMPPQAGRGTYTQN
jgi:hypothetical protein